MDPMVFPEEVKAELVDQLRRIVSPAEYLHLLVLSLEMGVETSTWKLSNTHRFGQPECVVNDAGVLGAVASCEACAAAASIDQYGAVRVPTPACPLVVAS